MKYGYFFYVIMGFLSGSILFGRLIPMIFRGVDVQTESEDGNPGTFNAFACGGAFCGILVLLADLGKGGASGCPVRQGSGNGFLDVCAGNGRACIRTCSFSVSERTWGARLLQYLLAY